MPSASRRGLPWKNGIDALGRGAARHSSFPAVGTNSRAYSLDRTVCDSAYMANPSRKEPTTGQMTTPKGHHLSSGKRTKERAGASTSRPTAGENQNQQKPTFPRQPEKWNLRASGQRLSPLSGRSHFSRRSLRDAQTEPEPLRSPRRAAVEVKRTPSRPRGAANAPRLKA